MAGGRERGIPRWTTEKDAIAAIFLLAALLIPRYVEGKPLSSPGNGRRVVERAKRCRARTGGDSFHTMLGETRPAIRRAPVETGHA